MKHLLIWTIQILATCSISYFVMMGVLQLYQWYVEKTVFFQADEEPAKKKGDEGSEAVRRWKWSSEMKR